MDTSILTITIVIVVVVLAVIGGLLAVAMDKRNHKEQLRNHFGPEYDHTVQTLGDERKAQRELEERENYIEALNIRQLTAVERTRYLADWMDVQIKFVDQPGQAILDADRLIMEVMNLRSYPISDFEQRAADLSVSYPSLVSNYRAARQIAIKNEQHLANTEDLRQALIYYRSLFEELLETEEVAV